MVRLVRHWPEARTPMAWIMVQCNINACDAQNREAKEKRLRSQSFILLHGNAFGFPCCCPWIFLRRRRWPDLGFRVRSMRWRVRPFGNICCKLVPVSSVWVRAAKQPRGSPHVPCPRRRERPAPLAAVAADGGPSLARARGIRGFAAAVELGAAGRRPSGSGPARPGGKRCFHTPLAGLLEKSRICRARLEAWSK